MRKRSVFLGVTLAFIWAGTATAAVWEELFSIAKDNVEVRIELKSSSFRQRLVRGEKIVSAHIRTFYREGRERTVATGDYEVHCAARAAYRSNLSLDVVAADRSKTSVHTAAREMLAGKEHSDFVGIMDILCAR